MDLKKFLIVAAIFACPTLYAQEVSSEVETEGSDSIVWTQEGFESAHAAMDAMGDNFGLRYDIEYLEDGSIETVLLRGGLYLSPRVGFEYNYMPKSGTNYPALSAELGVGYRTKRLDARAYVGLATCRYGNLSDKKAKYLSPRMSVEVLYEVARDHQYEENLFKIGGEVNYKLRRTYVDDEVCEFNFTGSYPGVALLLEYERQFWGSRSSITLGARFGTDCEIGNGIKAWGFAGGVYVSYRIGVQKKKIWDASSDAK